MYMKIKVVTPNGRIFESDIAESITLPTESGVITIKEGHVPMMSLIAPGEVVVIEGNGSEHALAISKGSLQINKDNSVNVLADTAERAEEIDVERAEEARKKAIELRVQAESEANVNYAALQAKIEKELARVEVGKKWKNFK